MSSNIDTVKGPEVLHYEKGAVTEVHHADGTTDFVDNAALGGELQDFEKGYFRSWKFIGTVIAQCLASCIAYLGWVLPANTLTLIAADLTSPENIAWAAPAWTMGSSVGFLLVGRLSDMFGRKWMVQSTTILSLIGCIVGATATSANAIIGANVLNGVAAAGQLSFAIVLGELVPNKHRGAVVSFVFSSSLPFAVFGPIIARSFILHLAQSWRWSYYLGIIMSGLVVILYQVCYFPPTFEQLHVGKTRWQAFKELDFVGIFLFIAASVLFLIGLSWGGTTYPWASAATLCPLLIGVATFAGFLVYEAYVPTVPLMPPRLFKNISFSAITAMATVGAMVYYAFSILWPIVLQTLYTTDVFEIGLQSSVVGGSILLGQIMGGISLSYLPGVKYQCLICSALSMALLTPLCTITAQTHTLALVLAILGIMFVGIVDNITFAGVTLVVDAADIGLATGTLGSIRGLGGAVAETLYVAVLNNKIAEYLPEYVSAAATQAGLAASSLPALFAGITSGSFDQVPGMNATIAASVGGAVQHAYADTFRVVFLTTIPFSLIFFFGGFWVPDMSSFLHYNVAKRLQNQSAASGATSSDDVAATAATSQPETKEATMV